MKEVYEYLKKCGTFYIATAQGDQPRVRPFGAVNIFEDKLYLITGKVKDFSKQLSANPNMELSGMIGDEGTWIRVAATLVNDDRLEAKQSMLDAYPMLNDRYKVDDDNIQVLYLKDATATIASFAGEPKVIKF